MNNFALSTFKKLNITTIFINYCEHRFMVSMAPLSYEVTPICCDTLPHFGPIIPQVNSVWFKLFLYSVTNSGPTSLLMPKGVVGNI